MAIFTPYTNLRDLKLGLGVSVTDDSQDAQLRRQIRRASRVITTLARGRRFVPWVETRKYDHPREPAEIQWGGTQYSYNNIRFSDTLRLDEDLLEINTLTTQNGSTTISSSDYFLMAGKSHNKSPASRIVLKLDGDQNTFLYSGTTQQSNSVAGIWGWHSDWDNAWLDSNDTVEDNPLSSSATSITVNDADGKDAFGLMPRFSEHQILRAGTEYLYLRDVNETTDTLTVVRGVNGSTAASHTQNTTLEVYRVPEDIQEAAISLISFWRTFGGGEGGAGGFGVESKTIGDYSVRYGGDGTSITMVNNSPVPATVASVVKAHRRVNI